MQGLHVIEGKIVKVVLAQMQEDGAWATYIVIEAGSARWELGKTQITKEEAITICKSFERVLGHGKKEIIGKEVKAICAGNMELIKVECGNFGIYNGPKAVEDYKKLSA